MNRSTFAVLLVGLLTIQGSVAGFIVGDTGDVNASNVTEGNSTTEESMVSAFSNHSIAAATTTEEHSSNNIALV